MGLLARRFETRLGYDWLNDDQTEMYGALTASGTRVTRNSSLRLSVIWACQRLLTNTIATLPTDIIVSINGGRFPEFNKPSWLTQPNPADPTMTSTEHFGQVTLSVLSDGNFFTFCPNSIFDPSPVVVLDPTRVEIRDDKSVPYYRVRDKNGVVVGDVDVMHMLHGVWLRMPGQLRGLNPIDAARQAIGIGLTTEEFASRFFGQGASLSFGVEVPGSLTEDQKKDLREQFKSTYAGTKKSHAIGILTAGAKFVPGLGVTNEQAQFLESQKFNRDRIASEIYGIPPHMVGSTEPGASSYNSVEQRSLEFREYAVLPLVRRIEDPYQRLVQVPPALINTTATAAFKFNLSGIARADLKTRTEANASAINSGQLTPDEARALEERSPLPGGDRLYIQSGTVPLDAPLPPRVVSPPQLPAGRAA